MDSGLPTTRDNAEQSTESPTGIRAFWAAVTETILGPALARQGMARWMGMFSKLVVASVVLIAVHLAGRAGWWPDFGASPSVGHVTRAYGTVRRAAWISSSSYGPWLSSLDESWNRLDSSRSILTPLRAGDYVQTGEDSAAEILFFGGSILRLEAGTLARFEDTETDVVLRVVLGRAFLELTDASLGNNGKFLFRKSNGDLGALPKSKSLMLTLNAAESLEQAVEIQEVESQGLSEAASELQLRYLAHGEEYGSQRRVLIVPPIEESEETGVRTPPDEASRGLASKVPIPKPKFPTDEGEQVDIENHPKMAVEWDKLKGVKEDPIVGYEITVRPAPGYEVEDTARKVQTFRTSGAKFPIEKINGAGVFLWTIRAVTAAGERGPASTPRWLEVKFPKKMFAPRIIKPKIQ